MSVRQKVPEDDDENNEIGNVDCCLISSYCHVAFQVHVCRGAEKSLLGLFGKSENLPGIAWTRKMDGHVQAEHSVSSLIRCVNENPGEISLVCLGPLTNLALALRLDPLIATNLRELIIVGGNIE
ncbi:inosine-uridine preferring nucleoside hydrolase, partial [Plakobranchus ocellatus]